MIKSSPQTQFKHLSALLLALWLVIILGFFLFPLMARECRHLVGDCPMEFLDEVGAMGNGTLLIQFGFFFFIAAICEFCFPEGISRIILEPEYTAATSIIKVLSPPPRISSI